MVRNGFGTQSLSIDFTTIAQWSDTSLFCTSCLHIGQLSIHFPETSNLSNLLFAKPLELNHVNFLPTMGISSKRLISMNVLKPLISLEWSFGWSPYRASFPFTTTSYGIKVTTQAPHHNL